VKLGSLSALANARPLHRAATRGVVALAMAAAAVTVAVPGAQANTCGTWSTLGPTYSITLDNQHVGTVYNEWNNCSGTSNYQVKAYWAWDSTWRTSAHAGVSGAYVQVYSLGLDSSADEEYVSESKVIGSTVQASDESPAVHGDENPDYLWQAEVEVTLDFTTGGVGYYLARTDTHDYANGATLTSGDFGGENNNSYY